MSYDYWNAALKGTAATPNVDDPQPGFYRLKRQNRWVPVAVWPTGILHGSDQRPGLGFKIGTEQVGFDIGVEQWPRYCSNPITEAIYRAVAEHGAQWPDGDPIVEAMLEKKSNGTPTLVEAPAKADPTTEFRENIDSAVGGVHIYAKIESDEIDVKALSLRNMLNDLALGAEKAAKAEYEPHYREYKRIYDIWDAMIKAARGGAADIKRARDAWADDKRKAAAEAQRRAVEAAEEHERKVAAAEAANKPAPPPPPPPSSNLPPPTAQVRPTYGKSSGTGTKVVVTEVDYDKMFKALKARPDWHIFAEGMRELAQKMASKGIILDGVTTEERSNTR